MSLIKPRLAKDKVLSDYLGGGRQSWLRNTRYDDEKRAEQELPPLGPPYFHIGRSVYYDLDEADTWIDSIKNGTNPAYQDEAA